MMKIIDGSALDKLEGIVFGGDYKDAQFFDENPTTNLPYPSRVYNSKLLDRDCITKRFASASKQIQDQIDEIFNHVWDYVPADGTVVHNYTGMPIWLVNVFTNTVLMIPEAPPTNNTWPGLLRSRLMITDEKDALITSVFLDADTKFNRVGGFEVPAYDEKVLYVVDEFSAKYLNRKDIVYVFRVDDCDATLIAPASAAGTASVSI
jgi:hypothetical protein